MNRRMKKLYKELTSPRELISAKNIIAGVNEKLNSDPSEKKRYKHQKALKGLAVAFAVIMSLALTALAVNSIDVNILRMFFSGDSSYMEQYVTEPGQSISDGRFRFSVDQALSTRNQIMLIFTVEALNDEGVRLLNYINVLDAIDIDFDDDTGSAWNAGFRFSEVHKMRTESSRTWSAYSQDVNNPDLAALKLSLGLMKKKKDIIVRSEGDVETFEFDLPGQPNGTGYLVMNPIGIRLARVYVPGEDHNFQWMDTYFRMNDGEIKTFNQLFSTEWEGNSSSEKPGLFEINTISREVLDLSKIKSVIVCGLEYDLRDPGSYTEAEVPDNIKPFEFKFEGDYIAVEDIFGHLGADIQWKKKGRVLSLSYNGIDTEITIGSSTVMVNGYPTELYFQSYLDEDGRVMVDADFIFKCIHMSYSCVDWNVPEDERVFMIYP